MSDLWPYFPFPTISTVVLLRTCSTSSPVSVHYQTLSFFIIYKAGLKAVNTINALSLFERERDFYNTVRHAGEEDGTFNINVNAAPCPLDV